MSKEITRREFLRLYINKYRRGAGIILRIVVGAAIALLGYNLISSFGVKFAAGFVFLVGLYMMVYYAKNLLYKRLGVCGKAFCHTVGDIFFVMVLMGCGIIAWEEFHSEDKLQAGMFSVFLFLVIIDKAVRVYRLHLEKLTGQTTQESGKQ